MSEKKYFDANKLIKSMYTQIAVWHNNEEKFSDDELGLELRLLCRNLAEEVIQAVHGEEASIEVDKQKLKMTEDEIKKDDISREKRREDIAKKVSESNESEKAK